MSDRVLVTGAAGFVGRHLIEQLVEHGISDIVATDIEPEPPNRYAEHTGQVVDYRAGDITDEVFRSVLLDETYDRVFHLAAVVGVSDYVKNPLEIVDVNVVVTKALLEELRHRDVRFVFTSTSEIYGKNPEVPWSETDDRVLGPPTIDRWSYSSGKSVCEHMIHGLGRTDGPFEGTVVRPFNLYGPGQRPNFVLPAFVERVVNDGVPLVYDDGRQTRCFTHVQDFVEGLRRASVAPEGANEVFNLGATRETSIKELAELVLQIAGHAGREPEYIDTDELYGESYEDLDRRVPDTTKAKQLLGWTAEMALETGIRDVLEWGREHY